MLCRSLAKAEYAKLYNLNLNFQAVIEVNAKMLLCEAFLVDKCGAETTGDVDGLSLLSVFWQPPSREPQSN